jgi:hypothetical protein
VCLTFDFDTQSGFIARGMTTPTPLSRGEFGLVGARPHSGLAEILGIHATWFIPGFTIESHPGACEAVVRDGHEVAHHSWAHIPPAQQSRRKRRPISSAPTMPSPGSPGARRGAIVRRRGT